MIPVAIGTRDRLELLTLTLKALERSTVPLSVTVVHDCDAKSLANIEELKRRGLHPQFYCTGKAYTGSVERANLYYHAHGTDAESILALGDDAEIEPDCVAAALAMLEREFPDGDGFIGLHDTKDNTLETAFALYGRKFIERFPAHAVFCPDYHHFSVDAELEAYALTSGRFRFCPEARLVHHQEVDNQKRMSWATKAEDETTREERGRRGLVWGVSFELITERGRRMLADLEARA